MAEQEIHSADKQAVHSTAAEHSENPVEIHDAKWQRLREGTYVREAPWLDHAIKGRARFRNNVADGIRNRKQGIQNQHEIQNSND